MIRFSGSTENLRRKADALIVGVRRVGREAMSDAARSHVRGMDKATPPRNRGAGEGKIAKDILQVLRGVPGPGDASPESAHRAARDSSGQTRKRGEKVRVNNAQLQRYLKRQTRKAGRLKSALNKAKQALGIAVPSWLSRHGDARGEFIQEETATGFVARIINKVPYASRVRTLAGAIPVSRSRAKAVLRNKVKEGVSRESRGAGF